MQQWQGHSHDICSRSASQGEGDPSLHFWEKTQEWMGDSAQTVLSSRAFALPSLSLLGTSWVNPGGENEVDGHCETSLRGGLTWIRHILGLSHMLPVCALGWFPFPLAILPCTQEPPSQQNSPPPQKTYFLERFMFYRCKLFCKK